MNKLFKNAFLTISLITLAACGDSGTKSSVSSNVKKMVAIGDSIAAGFGGTNPWPRLVQSKTGVPVVSTGVPRLQAKDAYSLTMSQLQANTPSHLIIMLGTNDANNGNINAGFSTIKRIVTDAQAMGVIPVVGTIPPSSSDAGFNQRASSLSAKYRTLGVTIAEVNGNYPNSPTLFQSDGFHPTNAGQDIIAKAFIDALK